jgi:hypothetical protein
MLASAIEWAFVELSFRNILPEELLASCTRGSEKT